MKVVPKKMKPYSPRSDSRKILVQALGDLGIDAKYKQVMNWIQVHKPSAISLFDGGIFQRELKGHVPNLHKAFEKNPELLADFHKELNKVKKFMKASDQ